jgi:hypothetical protein
VKGSKEFGELSVAEQNYKVGMINEFLEKMIMVTGQKGDLELDKVIYKETKKRDEINVDREVYGQVTQIMTDTSIKHILLATRLLM